jgi:hypothetical protein
MSGRASGQRGGRGGRGGRGYRNSNFKPNTPEKKKKTIDDYFFYVGSAKQASDYETSADFVINHIKKEYERGRDIAESLTELKLPDTSKWMPTLRASTNVDAAAQATENKQFDMEYKAKLTEEMRRIRIFNDNCVKSYALIWERCNTAMHGRLEQRTDFKSTIYNDPIELLRAIKECALNYQETRYEMSIISDALRALLNTRQREGENLQAFTRRFKTSKEILESHIGAPLVLKKFVETFPGYATGDQSAKNKLIHQANEQLMAFIYLENSDRRKYGSVLENLNSQKSLGNNCRAKIVFE